MSTMYNHQSDHNTPSLRDCDIFFNNYTLFYLTFVHLCGYTHSFMNARTRALTTTPKYPTLNVYCQVTPLSFPCFRCQLHKQSQFLYLNLYPLIKQLDQFDLLQGRHFWQFLFALLGAPGTSYVCYPCTSYTVSIPVYLWTILLAFILLQLLIVTVSLTGDHGWQQPWLSNMRSTSFFASIKTIIFKLPPYSHATQGPLLPSITISSHLCQSSNTSPYHSRLHQSYCSMQQVLSVIPQCILSVQLCWLMNARYLSPIQLQY